MSYCNKCGSELPSSVKFCHVCGARVQAVSPDNVYASQNPAPSAPSAQPYNNPFVQKVDPHKEEQKALDALSTRLKRQGLAWKISSFVLMAFLILFVLFGSVFAIVGGVVIADNQSYTYDYNYNYNDNYNYNFDDYNYDEFFNDFYNEYNEYSDDRFYEFNSFESNTAVGNDAEDFLGVVFIFYGLYFAFIGIFAFLPPMIAGFIMSKKVKKYRDNIYIDCSDAVSHSTSVGSIVLGALFNDVALVFIIINFVLTKKNRPVYDRIIANQKAYNTQYPQG